MHRVLIASTTWGLLFFPLFNSHSVFSPNSVANNKVCAGTTWYLYKSVELRRRQYGNDNKNTIRPTCPELYSSTSDGEAIHQHHSRTGRLIVKQFTATDHIDHGDRTRLLYTHLANQRIHILPVVCPFSAFFFFFFFSVDLPACSRTLGLITDRIPRPFLLHTRIGSRRISVPVKRLPVV